MRSLTRVSLLALAVCAAAAVAFDPPQVVEVPRPAPAKWQEFRAEPGRTIRLSLKDGESASWVLAEEGTSSTLSPQDTPTAFVDFVGPKGRHCLIAHVPGKPAARIVVVVGDGTSPPVDPPPPGMDPPPPGQSTLYFVIVRLDGPASPAFTKVMSMPEWEQLRKDGHKIKDYEHSEAVRNRYVKGDLILPCVVTLRVSADGNSAAIVRGPVELPTTSAGILDLPKGVKP